MYIYMDRNNGQLIYYYNKIMFTVFVNKTVNLNSVC